MRPVAAHLLALLCVARFTVAQMPYHHDATHWELTIPAGWELKPQSEIKTLDDELKRRVPDKNYEYLVGFQPSRPTDKFPYVIVQKTAIPLQGATYADLERAFGAKELKDVAHNAAQKIGTDLLKSADIDQPTLERATNRVFISMKMTGADGTAMRGLSVMHLTQTGAIQVNFYSRAETFEQDVAQFDAFLSSFKLDPGQEFVPTMSSDWLFTVGNVGVGTAVAITLAVIIVLKKRGKATA